MLEGLSICDYIRRVAGIWGAIFKEPVNDSWRKHWRFACDFKRFPKEEKVTNPARLWWERQEAFTRHYEDSHRPFLGFWLNKKSLELGQDHRARRGQIKKLQYPEWWDLAPAVRGKVSGDLCEFQASLIYIASYRPARATLWYLTQIQNIFILFIIT